MKFPKQLKIVALIAGCSWKSRAKPLDSAVSGLSEREGLTDMLSNRLCPRCDRTEFNIYFSGDTDEILGAWCQNCNLKAYFDGNELIPMRYSE